tara:strand:+ start:542 stop:880 length:339 start_codon:yes stop_codon:yes gene_type:complete
MKKFYSILSVLFLIYWGCEDKQDKTPTELTLWGINYSIEDTESLDLSSTGLTGSIPWEICNLTSLTYLNFTINQLYPPYPSCVEDYVGEQNLSNCDGFFELWGEYYSIDNTT